MKFAMSFLSLIFTVLILTNSAYAETPREQLKQLVGQLQANPSDDVLREKIIKLAQKLKPAPAIPEDAERRMVRGTAAFKGAKSVADYRDAAKEFEKATLAAPWYGDAYLNLGVTQDKEEDYEAALRSLKFALLASPNDKEIKALIYEVEYRNEKENSPEGLHERFLKKVRMSQQQFAGLVRELDGASFLSVYRDKDGVLNRQELRFYREAEGNYLGCKDPNREGLLGGVRFVVPTSESQFDCGSYGSFRLYDGSRVLDAFSRSSGEVWRSYKRQ